MIIVGDNKYDDDGNSFEDNIFIDQEGNVLLYYNVLYGKMCNIKAEWLTMFKDKLQYYTGAVQLYLPVYTKLFILARVSASGGPRDPYLYWTSHISLE